MELAVNPDKGPYFAAAILHSAHSKDLSYRIDGLIMENRQYLEMAMNDMTLRKNNMANALRELQNSNIFYRKIRAEQYVQAVNKYVCQMAKIHLFEIAGKTLDQFKHQIPELYTSNRPCEKTVNGVGGQPGQRPLFCGSHTAFSTQQGSLLPY